MLYVSIECGSLSETQREELVCVTATCSQVMKVSEEFFSVTIKELPDKNFGIGGKTIDVVKKEYLENHAS